jgi:hypothetical protein
MLALAWPAPTLKRFLILVPSIVHSAPRPIVGRQASIGRAAGRPVPRPPQTTEARGDRVALKGKCTRSRLLGKWFR